MIANRVLKVKILKRALFVGAALPILLPSISRADNVRVTNPSAFSFELFGRGLRYGVYFDEVVSEDVAVGIGIGSVALNFPNSGADAGTSATLIPAYVNYYFAREAGSLYITAGAALVTSPSNVNDLTASLSGLQFNSNSILPSFGLGYEYRTDPGFLFRVTGYGLISGNFEPWVGFTFGYAF